MEISLAGQQSTEDLFANLCGFAPLRQPSESQPLIHETQNLTRLLHTRCFVAMRVGTHSSPTVIRWRSGVRHSRDFARICGRLLECDLS
jgi:hypothetical protein